MDFQSKYERLEQWSRTKPVSGCPDLPEDIFYSGLLSGAGIQEQKRPFLSSVLRKKALTDREVLAFCLLYSRNKNQATRKLLSIALERSRKKIGKTATVCAEALLEESAVMLLLLSITVLWRSFVCESPKEAHDLGVYSLILRRQRMVWISRICGSRLSKKNPGNPFLTALSGASLTETAKLFWERVPWEKPTSSEKVWALETSPLCSSWERACCWEYMFLIRIIREIYALS